MSNLELTFHKPSRRWKKMIDGKVRYFGYGKSKSDRKSYKAALAKYRQFMEQRQQEETRPRVRTFSTAPPPADILAIVNNRELAYALGKLRLLGVDVSQFIEQQNGNGSARIGEADAEADADVDHSTGQDGEKPKRQKDRIADLVDSYVDEQKQRHELTKKNPGALPKKRRLGKRAFITTSTMMKGFKNWVDEDYKWKRFGDSDQTERILAAYRQHLDKRMSNGEISPSTVSNRVRAIRPFIKWLWTSRYIDDLPRNLEQVCQQYGHEKKAKSIDVKTLRAIWKEADERLKALIAVALNCGFYGKEIASIRVEHWRNGYIAKRREKTGVASKHNLWKVTEQLIKRQKDGKHPDDYLFVTKKGYPLVHEGENSICDSIFQTWAKFRNEHPQFKGIQWSHFRDTSATNIENIGRRAGNTTLVSQFLAHADGRTAQFYIDSSAEPMDLETTVLDGAIDELGTLYELTMPKGKTEKAKK